jgi:hypothetical protein
MKQKMTFFECYEVRHIKSNEIYIILDDCVTNTTNKDDQKRMVLYIKKSKGTIKKKFIREYSEFINKFESIRSC